MTIEYKHYKNLESIFTPSRKYKISLKKIISYGFVRDIFYNAYSQYKEKENFDKNILDFEKQKQFEPSKNLKFPTEQDPLYHFSVAGAINVVNSWQTTKIRGNEINYFLAFQGKKMVGYSQYVLLHKPEPFSDHKVIYIAQLGVHSTFSGQGIGSTLMSKVMLYEYTPNTSFYLITRNFNDAAIHLYENKLKFSPFEKTDQFIFDNFKYDNKRYIGFKKTGEIISITEIDEDKKLLK